MLKVKWTMMFVLILIMAVYLRNSDHKPGVAMPHVVTISIPTAAQTTTENDRATMATLEEHDRNDPIRMEFQQAFDQALNDFRKQQERVAEVCKKTADPALCRTAQVRSEVAWTSLRHQISALNRHEHDYNERYINVLPKTLEDLDKSWNQ